MDTTKRRKENKRIEQISYKFMGKEAIFINANVKNYFKEWKVLI